MTCPYFSDKKAYRTRKHAKKMVRMSGTHQRGNRPYRCDGCGQWHLGKGDAQTRARTRRWAGGKGVTNMDLFTEDDLNVRVTQADIDATMLEYDNDEEAA